MTEKVAPKKDGGETEKDPLGTPEEARTRASSSASLPRWFRHTLRLGLHLAADGSAVVFAYWAAYRLRFHWPWWTHRFPVPGLDPEWWVYSELMWLIVPLWLALFWYSSRLYTRHFRNSYDRVLRICKGAVLGTAAVLVATYVFDRLQYSRLMLFMAAPLGAAAVVLSQTLVLWVDSWMARLETVDPLLVLGGGHVSELICSNLRARHPRIPIREIPEVPSPEEVLRAAAEEGARDVVLVRRGLEHAKLLELAEACETAGLSFRMIPDLLELRLGEVQMDESLGVPAYRLQHTSLDRGNYLAKRAFDIAFTLAVFAVFGLPLLVVAALIRWDSKGPALYKQRRIGLKGRIFEAYKFRSMVVNAEAALSQVKGLNDQKGGFFKAKQDPRITRVGRWLRRFSVDEFPQFINVLKGEMSVVGPRPLAEKTGEIEELVRLFGPTARKRLNTLPGITGLWQVSGRSDISSEQRFALDMFYIEHWSLGLDLEIILRTIPAMISGKGAY